MIERGRALELDRADELAHLRDLFVLPAGKLYFDGNSLGATPKSTLPRLRRLVEEEWAQGLVSSWTEAGWMDLPRRVGAKIARLVGAEDDSCIVADSTSVVLYKALLAALHINAGHNTILTEEDNFPTDLYIADAVAQAGNLRLVRARRDQIIDSIDKDVAAVMLTHVDYRSGEMLEMAAITAAAHRAGALAIWDLSHSTGAVPLQLAADGVDFAVGCGYKYLNGGPGAPAFIYVSPRHYPRLRNPIAGWLGHANPFLFAPQYEPAPGVGRMLSGSPSVMALAALDCSLDIFLDTDMQALRRKSLALSDFFFELVAGLDADAGVAVVTPRPAAHRGSQISLRHAAAYEISRALIARGVIIDFRPPDIIRFGLPALYTSFTDIWDAVVHLREILATAEHRQFAQIEKAPIP